MLVCLKAGQKMPEHSVAAKVIVQTLSGRARFYDGSTLFEMTAGALLRLEAGRPHAVEAIENSVLSATILGAGEETRTTGKGAPEISR
jgi:quercetin dioxygenase-like cupin family protein